MMFCVYLLDYNGQGSYLSVKGRHEWRTKRTASKHGQDIAALVNNGKTWQHVCAVWIENEFGDIVKSFPINKG